MRFAWRELHLGFVVLFVCLELNERAAQKRLVLQDDLAREKFKERVRCLCSVRLFCCSSVDLFVYCVCVLCCNLGSWSSSSARGEVRQVGEFVLSFFLSMFVVCLLVVIRSLLYLLLFVLFCLDCVDWNQTFVFGDRRESDFSAGRTAVYWVRSLFFVFCVCCCFSCNDTVTKPLKQWQNRELLTHIRLPSTQTSHNTLVVVVVCCIGVLFLFVLVCFVGSCEL